MEAQEVLKKHGVDTVEIGKKNRVYLCRKKMTHRKTRTNTNSEKREEKTQHSRHKNQEKYLVTKNINCLPFTLYDTGYFRYPR